MQPVTLPENLTKEELISMLRMPHSMEDFPYYDQPPAVWLLLAALVAAGVWLYARRFSYKRRLRVEALAAWEKAVARTPDSLPGRRDLALQASMILRRLAMLLYTPEKTASLYGKAWGSFLNARATAGAGASFFDRLPSLIYDDSEEGLRSFPKETVRNAVAAWIVENTK